MLFNLNHSVSNRATNLEVNLAVIQILWRFDNDTYNLCVEIVQFRSYVKLLVLALKMNNYFSTVWSIESPHSPLDESGRQCDKI